MNVRFNLKNKNTQKTLILLKIRYNKSEKLPFVFSTSQHIDPKFWDYQKMRAFPSITVKRKKIHFPQSTWLNALLDKYETIVLDCLRMELTKSGNFPTHSELRKYILEQFYSKKITITFLDFFQSEIDKRENDPTFKKISLKSYNSCINNIRMFEKETGNKFIFSKISVDLIKKWQGWNYDQGKAKNTIAGYNRKLNVVLSAAYKEGYISSEVHKDKELRIGFQRADVAYLTPKELMKLYHLDLNGSHLEKDRDFFLFAAFTGGYRLGDLSDLDGANIVPMQGKSIIQFKARKTGTNVSLPASWYFSEFVEKYKGNFPKMKTGQKFNKNIKVIAKKAGLNRPVKMIKNKGGKQIAEVKPLHQWITQYTARYSFATNLFLAGVPITQISKLLGHSRVSTTEGYIKAKQLQTVMSIADNPYFTEKPKDKRTNKIN